MIHLSRVLLVRGMRRPPRFFCRSVRRFLLRHWISVPEQANLDRPFHFFCVPLEAYAFVPRGEDVRHSPPFPVATSFRCSYFLCWFEEMGLFSDPLSRRRAGIRRHTFFCCTPGDPSRLLLYVFQLFFLATSNLVVSPAVADLQPPFFSGFSVRRSAAARMRLRRATTSHV